MKKVKIKSYSPGELSNYFKMNGVTIEVDGVTFSEEDPIELEIEGCLNSADVEFFRMLCGGTTAFGRKKYKGKVKVLNLAEVTFVSDYRYYFTTSSEYGNTAGHKTNPQTVSSYMFAKLEEIDKIILPKNTETIERDAFYGCSAKEIILPNNIQLLEEEAFHHSRVETIHVNAVKIKQKCFYGCIQLKRIFLGKNVKHINGAFNYSINLEEIELADDNKELKLTDCGLVNKKETQLILYAQKADCTELVVPEKIERICGGAFQGKNILTNVIFPDSLQYIGRNALSQTRIEEIHIPFEVKSISHNAFPSTLKRIYFHSAIPPETKNAYLFTKEISIFVPKGCMDQYKKEFKFYAESIQEADYMPQERKTKKEVKNRAFYKALVNEIKEIPAMEITDFNFPFVAGRFSGETFLNVWKSNLYYIKWMVRLWKITNISNEVFVYLLERYPLKRPAINNLKGLVTVSQIKRAKMAEERERLKEEYFEYLSEHARWQQEQDEIREANRLFEEMMNEYEAWGNID